MDAMTLNDLKAQPPRLLVVTGLSGAGRSTALNFLEDLGFEAIDNMPAHLLPALSIPKDETMPPLAIGIDSRTRNLLSPSTLDYLDNCKNTMGKDFKLLFLECSDSALERRFVVTRRRHPMLGTSKLKDTIEKERLMLAPLKDRSDLVLDTTSLLPARLKLWLKDTFFSQSLRLPVVHVLSFSYKKGLPPEADVVFDMRFMQNPFYIDELRPLNGTDRAVGDYIRGDKKWGQFWAMLKDQLALILPAYGDEGKSLITIAFGCTGGQHRSVFTAKTTAEWLMSEGWQAHIHHQDLEK
jgi:RNase adapter protein RapZ